MALSRRQWGASPATIDSVCSSIKKIRTPWYLAWDKKIFFYTAQRIAGAKKREGSSRAALFLLLFRGPTLPGQ
ncbi:hypothetical protein PSAC2689_40116 [Paraburkholderia sacchari]